MKTKFLTIIIVFTSLALLAQPQVIIKQKAKNLRDDNLQKQGVQQAAPKQAPPQNTGQTGSKLSLSPQQENSISQIIGTLDKIEPAAQIDPTLKSDVRKQLSSLIQIPVNIRADTLDKLAEEMAALWQMKKLNVEQSKSVLKDVAFILNGRELSSQSISALLFDIQKQLSSAGITQQQAQTFINALKSVYSEIKK
jgi:hypothetical protein